MTTAPAVTTSAARTSTTASLSAPSIAGAIAFGDHVGKGNDDICVVNADGTGLSVVPGIEKAMDPAWRPE